MMQDLATAAADYCKLDPPDTDVSLGLNTAAINVARDGAKAVTVTCVGPDRPVPVEAAPDQAYFRRPPLEKHKLWSREIPLARCHCLA